MAGFASALAASASYAGLRGLCEYVNWDGQLAKWNCGLAAAATMLAHHGWTPASAEEPLREIERDFPPDILGGWFGTSRRRVVRICKAHGVRLREIRGEAALRVLLANGTPVIVMTEVPAGKFLGRDLPGGHWMVAYGFDEASIYLTNWGPMTWVDFRRRWRSLISRAIQMNERGLVATRESL